MKRLREFLDCIAFLALYLGLCVCDSPDLQAYLEGTDVWSDLAGARQEATDD